MRLGPNSGDYQNNEPLQLSLKANIAILFFQLLKEFLVLNFS